MNTKKYVICTDLDFEKVAVAALKKVFSTTLFPRVLCNIQNEVLLDNFQKNLDFECFFTENSRIFARNVHFDCFDIGIFFFKCKDKLCLKIYDGNGLLAGTFVTNIFDYVFSLTPKEFEQYKNEVLNDYNSLNKNHLLVQKDKI